MQNIAILMITMMTSLFVLKIYNKYGSFLFRLTISLILSTFALMAYTETHTFINFPYLGIIALILINLLDLEKLNKGIYSIVVIFSFLICLSKSHYVTLIPITLIVIIFARKKLKKRDWIFLVAILTSSLIQLVYSYRNMNMWIRPDSQPMSFYYLINSTLHQTIQQIIYIYTFLK